ncbi:MAG: HAMP domain-containing histidine kinase [Treponema sp.]|uniref:HAMP domain-containing sensor histidine kinase n=1 Tax=Treponema sp. TaxID=166 RepID=UPI00298EAEC2|nr:HAMP domain-containing sensor histidine kinase [Treponema sp.]MCQ2601840.1 HAMP domain-containing histidine kinase [Treponema sp.]
MKQKKVKKLSISSILAFRFTFILTAVVILLVLVFSRIQLVDLNNQRTVELDRSISIIERTYLTHIEETPEERFTIKRIPKHLGYLIYKIDGDQIITVDTNSDEVPPVPFAEKKAKYYTKRTTPGQEIKIIYMSRPVQSDQSVVIQLWIDVHNDSLYQMKHDQPRIILISLIPILVICYFITYFIARNIMQPVVKMTEDAKNISSSSLDTFLPVKNNGDELDELAKTFNDLFSRLKIDFDRERQFTSDVSHELKTPVAVILGQANLLRRWGKNDPVQLDKSINTIISETKSMDAIIQNLLQMTRIESGKIIPSKEEFLLSELFDKIREEVEILDPTCEINFNYDPELKITTDFELLHQSLMVCVSNSLKFCPKPLKLTITASDANQSITIHIADNGPGFAPDIIPHVFERFYRGDDAHTRSAGGSGLGLSIAKTIIHSLGGTISASNDEITKGAKLSISINSFY